jgi:hypothetical protein
MAITTNKLSRAAGLCAVVAGLLYIIVQFIHPDETVEQVTTTVWILTHWLTLAMGVFALIGISGMYFRQVTETGVLGLIGFLLFGAFFLMVVAQAFVETVVLPAISEEAPAYVNDYLAAVVGRTVRGDVGSFTVVNAVTAPLYLLGGLLFGIALYRAGILARWAALLLAIGAPAALLVGVLPESLDRLLALPVGIALAGLGYSLWRESELRPSPASAA